MDATSNGQVENAIEKIETKWIEKIVVVLGKLDVISHQEDIAPIPHCLYQ